MPRFLHVPLDLASGAIPAAPAQPYAVLLAKGTTELGLYAPQRIDDQSPHDRDEFYVVISGTGDFVVDGETIQFRPGDTLFVEAGVEHRFERFTVDLMAWVIFV